MLRSRRAALGAALGLAIASIGCASATTYRPLAADAFRTADGWYDFRTYRYRGELQGGLPNGRGEVRYANGTAIVGRFADGVATGSVTVTIPRYGRIEGEARDGDLVSGTAWLDDGSYYRGGFRNGRFDGTGVAISARGELAKGQFRNGALNGPGTRVAPDGTLTEGTFRDGRPTGDALVLGGSGAQLRSFDANGADVTDRTIADKVIDAAVAVKNGEISARRREQSAAEAALSAAVAAADRLRDVDSPAFEKRFLKQCSCTFLSNNKFADPTAQGLALRTGGCLTVSNSDEEARRTPAEKARLERAENDRVRACIGWLEEIGQPGRAERAEGLIREANDRAQAVAEAGRARMRAEDEARQLEQQRRLAQYEQSIREGIARAEAERKAAADRREAEHRNKCSTIPSYAACYCQPPRPPDPKRPGASCQ